MQTAISAFNLAVVVEEQIVMSHHSGPSTPVAAITAIDEKLTDLNTSVDSATLTPTHQTPGQTTPAEPEHEVIPYWRTNVPRDRWPSTCPEFLQGLSKKNMATLAIVDSTYRRQDWGSVKELVRTNRIDQFQRVPSDLRKYLEYMYHIKRKYGSVMKFVIKERLRWGDGQAEHVKPRGRPFEYDDDLKILYNDWPYGVEKGIVHLVVWTKFELDEDPATGDLTAAMRQAIEEFVQKTFCSQVPSDQVIWFKNWKSLKSVHAIEHFHIMLYNPDIEFVKEITKGDVPLVEKV